MITAALECLIKGWSVFPLVPNEKVPFTRNGFKNASKSIEEINTWWNRNPKSNIGIATGKESGIVVIDVDVKKDKNGIRAKGRESAARIQGLLPPTYTVLTTTGGWHLYYRTKSSVKSRIGFMPGLDVKAEGGYVVGAGSKIYEKEYIAQQRDIVDVSEILKLQINREDKKQIEWKREKSSFNGSINIEVGPNNWHFPMLKAVGWMVWRGLSDSEILQKAESYTMPGFTIEQTRKEVSEMILGARRKGFDK